MMHPDCRDYLLAIHAETLRVEGLSPIRRPDADVNEWSVRYRAILDLRDGIGVNVRNLLPAGSTPAALMAKSRALAALAAAGFIERFAACGRQLSHAKLTAAGMEAAAKVSVSTSPTPSHAVDPAPEAEKDPSCQP